MSLSSSTRFAAFHRACLVLVLLMPLLQPTHAQICFMLYQLADTANIEPSLIDDLVELTKSPGIRDTALITWVYHDGRNLDGTDQSQTTPLPNIWTSDGSQLLEDVRTTKFEGSRYFTYRHDWHKMVVARVLEGEQNSDAPHVLQNFLVHSMTDCIAKGAQEFFVVLASHGTGYAGFGGDDNPQRRRQLALPQPNWSIANTLRTVLEMVPGAPTQYDVIGFDACHMQSLGTIDDYANITKYFLGSQAEEPAHGWNYEALTDVTSARAMAGQLVRTFATATHGSDTEHKTPKSMAVTDTLRYLQFEQAFNSLLEVLADLLWNGHDANLYAHLHRARAASIAFKSYNDIAGTQYWSAIDIGDFLATFDSFCNPSPDTTLATALASARYLYSRQYASVAVGPGTPAGATGMTVLWPKKTEYLRNTDYWTRFTEHYAGLSNNTMPQFLEAYFNAGLPTTSVGNSYCANNGVSNIQPSYPHQMLLSPSITENVNSIFVQSEITVSTTSVMVEYGLDVTSLAFGGRRRRQRRDLFQTHDQESTTNTTARIEKSLIEGVAALPERVKALEKQLAAEDTSTGSHSIRGRRRLATSTQRRRRTNGRRWFILHGGNFAGRYCSPTYTATWDRSFYMLGDFSSDAMLAATMVPVYATVQDVLSLSVPVVLFQPTDMNGSKLSSGLPFMITVRQIEQQYEGSYSGFITFSLDPETLQLLHNLALFANLPGGTTVEVSNYNWYIAPVTYVDVQLTDGTWMGELVGGFTGKSILRWTTGHSIGVLKLRDTQYVQKIPDSHVIADMTAYDEDSVKSDLVVYNNIGSGQQSQSYPPIGPTNCATVAHSLTAVTRTKKKSTQQAPNNKKPSEDGSPTSEVFGGSMTGPTSSSAPSWCRLTVSFLLLLTSTFGLGFTPAVGG